MEFSIFVVTCNLQRCEMVIVIFLLIKNHLQAKKTRVVAHKYLFRFTINHVCVSIYRPILIILFATFHLTQKRLFEWDRFIWTTIPSFPKCVQVVSDSDNLGHF